MFQPCTFENGATQIIVGSHKWGDERGPPNPALCSTAAMDTGDVVMIIGSVRHGAGENITSNERRNIYSMHMVRGTLRQDENQYLGIPIDRLKNLSIESQRLIAPLSQQVSLFSLDVARRQNPF